MNIRQTVRRACSLGLTAVFAASVVTSSLLVLTTQTASAELTPLPEPVSPGENCEWMGEMHLERDSERYDNPSGTGLPSYSESQTLDVHGVSAPVPGEDCGMLWAGNLHMTSVSLSDATCTAAPGDIMTVTRQIDATGSGTGNHTISLEEDLNSPGNEYLFIWQQATTTNGLRTDIVTVDLCGFNSNFSSAYKPSILNHFCRGGAFPTKVGLHTNSDAQAYVGYCENHEVYSTSTHSKDHYEKISWRFKKVNCDPTVDSDGGGTSDCQEYEDGTNPMDASDDISVVSPEMQNIIDTATTTGNECLGKVTQSAAKEAAAQGKGVRQIIEEWELSGLSGVDEDSTFQQKKNAIQEFCKEN